WFNLSWMDEQLIWNPEDHKRRPTFYVQTIILPIMVLSFLNVMTFWLPDDSGEKISFATSVLLSLTVFLSITSGLLPQTSDKPPV
ncbi:neuronal acetylcholine receptor subunit non-alpha-2-like, partial [Patella vulgata]|uniref:neuronal acetylcholine receptor subunit non-alpha-2-like n=1 Tax=Patella vulgata TaxID=6465 RepID=UPI0024A98DED